MACYKPAARRLGLNNWLRAPRNHTMDRWLKKHGETGGNLAAARTGTLYPCLCRSNLMSL